MTNVRIVRICALAAVCVAAACTSQTGSTPPIVQPTQAPAAPAIYAYVPSANALVAAYPEKANGKTSPGWMLQGALTQIAAGNGGIAVDKDGTLYVLTGQAFGGTPVQLLVFPPGFTGNTAPSRVVPLAATGISGIALDGYGNFWTVNIFTNRLERYSLNATGTAHANASILGKLATPVGLLRASVDAVATDADGNVYCACALAYRSAQAAGVTKYHVTKSGRPGLVRSFYDFQLPEVPPSMMAVDSSTGTIYLASVQGDAGIFAYDKPMPEGLVENRRRIGGPQSGFTDIDALYASSGLLYAALAGPTGSSIAVFNSKADYNAVPIRRIRDDANLMFGLNVFGSFIAVH